MLKLRNYMTKSKLIKSCQFLLFINIIFWLFMVFYSFFYRYANNNNFLIIKILLFIEPILYFISLIGINKRIKLIYLCSIILAFGNTVLSVTDQIGLSDVISLLLSFFVFLNLVLIWKYIFKSPKEVSY